MKKQNGWCFYKRVVKMMRWFKSWNIFYIYIFFDPLSILNLLSLLRRLWLRRSSKDRNGRSECVNGRMTRDSKLLWSARKMQSIYSSWSGRHYRIPVVQLLVLHQMHVQYVSVDAAEESLESHWARFHWVQSGKVVFFDTRRSSPAPIAAANVGLGRKSSAWKRNLAIVAWRSGRCVDALLVKRIP